MSITLRPYQTAIIDQIRSHMSRGVRSILVQSPTGSGKTALTAHMLMASAQKNFDSWFINHRRELIKQSSRTFDKVGVRHGIIAAGFEENLSPKIQVASIATLINRIERLRSPAFIVWDECHHLGATSWSRVFKANPQAFHVGLTATPERLDGRGLSDYFSVMVNGPDVSWLIEQGYLSKYKAFAPGRVNLSSLHTRMGDYIKAELTSVLDKPTIIGDAIAEYKKKAANKKTVVFSFSIEHSKHIVEAYNRAGFKFAHVDGESDLNFRDEMIQAFTEGSLDGLSNVDLFSEGFDLPAIECVQMMRPTQSLGLYLQQVGRALRLSHGKIEAIILDHVGNIERHGLPDEARKWTLDGRDTGNRKGKSEASVKVCLKCFAAQNPGKSHCQFCGAEFELKVRKIAQAEGDLEEISTEEIKKRKKLRQAEAKNLSYKELVELGKLRGYSDPQKWAFFVNRQRQRKKLGIA